MTTNWLIEKHGKLVAAARSNTRRKGESRRQRVIRNASELAAEAHIDVDEARKRLRGGNPLGSATK